MTTHNADRLAAAKKAVLDAVREYRRVSVKGQVPEATALSFTPSTALIDNRRFKTDSVNAIHPFADDAVLGSMVGADLPDLQASLLSFSPHWEDRIRAAALQASIRNEITMPNGFPCIYEPADSPVRSEALYPQEFVWVASPDESMLRELLPLYRQLWEAYEAQWPHSLKRVFRVGRLDRVSPSGVYRPGTTPDQVIGQTMLTHTDMYRTAPENLRQMHPLHESWTASRRRAVASSN